MIIKANYNNIDVIDSDKRHWTRKYHYLGDILIWTSTAQYYKKENNKWNTYYGVPCEMPDIEKEYQNYIRTEKLKRKLNGSKD
jgi:hypothetical protein